VLNFPLSRALHFPECDRTQHWQCILFAKWLD